MKSLFAIVVLLALLCIPVAAQTKTGTDTVTLTNIYGVTQTGQVDASATPACWQKYHGLLGEKVVTDWSINPSTGIMIAKSTLLGASVVLHPLGISSVYAFMSGDVPPELKDKGITRVIFELNLQFQNPRSSLLATLDTENNCVIDNSVR